MIRRVLVVAVVVAAAVGCAGDDDASEPAEPLSFDEQVCLSVALWSEGLAAAVNRFQEESRQADGPAERRQLYLAAWDRVDAEHEDLRADLGELDTDARPYGTAVVTALDTALDAAETEGAGGREEAGGLPEASYERVTVPDGNLFRGTEKMRSLLFHALNDTAVAEGVDALGGDCGRRPLINERSE